MNEGSTSTAVGSHANFSTFVLLDSQNGNEGEENFETLAEFEIHIH